MRIGLTLALLLSLCLTIAAQPDALTNSTDQIKAKDNVARAAFAKAQIARAKAEMAKAAYMKALDMAVAAERESAKADRDYRVVLAEEAEARARALRAEADKAESRLNSPPVANPPVANPPVANPLEATTQGGRDESPGASPAKAGPIDVRDIGHPKVNLAGVRLPKREDDKPSKAMAAMPKARDKVGYIRPKDGDRVTSGVIMVKLPATAELTIDGNKTKAIGMERRFMTPPLPVGQPYYYNVRMTHDGLSANRRITVTPGETTTIDFTR